MNNQEAFYLILKKYFYLSQLNNEIELFNVLDYLNHKIKNKTKLSELDFKNLVKKVKINEIINYMLEDAKINPKKYI